PRERVDLTERAAERIAIGPHGERFRRGVVQPGREQLPKALVAPEALAQVALRVRLLGFAGREVHRFARYFPARSLRLGLAVSPPVRFPPYFPIHDAATVDHRRRRTRTPNPRALVGRHPRLENLL